MKLLHIDSSILGPNSVSRLLTAQIVAGKRRLMPDLTVVYRDLAATPISHLSGELLAAGQSGEVNPKLAGDLQDGKAALEEFLAADMIVVGAPMYNFTVPSQLKSWIDRIVVAGKTFRYGPKGPEGLAGGKKVIVASTRGGAYGADSGLAFLDHQESYLQAIFGFVGINDISFIRAEGLSKSDHRAQSIESAKTAIAALA